MEPPRKRMRMDREVQEDADNDANLPEEEHRLIPTNSDNIAIETCEEDNGEEDISIPTYPEFLGVILRLRFIDSLEELDEEDLDEYEDDRNQYSDSDGEDLDESEDDRNQYSDSDGEDLDESEDDRNHYPFPEEEDFEDGNENSSEDEDEDYESYPSEEDSDTDSVATVLNDEGYFEGYFSDEEDPSRAEL